MNLPVHTPNGSLKRRLLYIFFLVVIVTCLVLAQWIVSRPMCFTVSDSTVVGVNQNQSDSGVIRLARRLGAKEPVIACNGNLLDRVQSFDGYNTYTIRIPASGKRQVETLGCPPRPLDDHSNPTMYEKLIKHLVIRIQSRVIIHPKGPTVVSTTQTSF